MNKKDEKRVLEEMLSALTPHANRGAAEPSAARLYIREHFEALSAARDRGISWPQIAGVLAQARVFAADGSVLEWRTISSLFHAERYARGERRKRRSKKPVSQPQQTGQPRPAIEPTFVADESQHDHDDHQRGKFRVIPARPRGAPPRKQET